MGFKVVFGYTVSFQMLLCVLWECPGLQRKIKFSDCNLRKRANFFACLLEVQMNYGVFRCVSVCVCVCVLLVELSDNMISNKRLLYMLLNQLP